jgi:hypothetical protein
MPTIRKSRADERPWRRTRRLSYREIKFYVMLLLLIVLFGGQVITDGLSGLGFGSSSFLSTGASAQFQTQEFSITDGDTIRMSDGTPVRLVGFNTPEKFEPQCDSEAVLGNRGEVEGIGLLRQSHRFKSGMFLQAWHRRD